MEFVRLAEFNSIPMLRLTGDQTAAMIKVAAKPPPERAQMSKFSFLFTLAPDSPRCNKCNELIAPVRQWRQTLDYSNLPKIKAWNVEVNANMMQIGARILQPPQVQYGKGQSQRPNFG